MTVLTKEFGLENFTAPNGRVFGVRAWHVNPSLLELFYADDKGGSLPERLQGKYTKRAEAERALKAFLEEFWKMSEEQSEKNRKRA